MENPLPGTCPVCRGSLHVTALRCSHCDTGLTGRFETCAFCRLDRQQQLFVKIFLQARGSIKEMERELGISYPTVRARLASVVRALGLEPEVERVDRAEVLERLEKGELTPEEATGLLNPRRS